MVAPDILLVAATVLIGFASAGAVSAWADRRVPVVAFGTLFVALLMVAAAHFGLEGGITLRAFPEAFVQVAARILN